MEARELRIGNWVQSQTSEGMLYGQVYRIDTKTFGLSFKDMPSGRVRIGGYEPIPLTEEWLVRLGFEEIDYKHSDRSVTNGHWKRYPVGIERNMMSEGNSYWRVVRYVPSQVGVTNFITHVNKVHQLQNLYFALTGNDLVLDGGG